MPIERYNNNSKCYYFDFQGIRSVVSHFFANGAAGHNYVGLVAQGGILRSWL